MDAEIHWLEGLDEEDEVRPALVPEVMPVMPKRGMDHSVGPKPTRDDFIAIKEEEDALLKDSLEVLHGALNFAELPFDAVEPPQEWIDLLGEEDAHKKFRLIKAGQMSAKDAPVGVKVATSLATGIIKARATEKAAPRLSVNVITLPTLEAAKSYDEMSLDEDT